jgi:hypothetical protein
VGYFDGMGIGGRSGTVTVRGQKVWLPGPMAVLALGRRVLLRKRGTQFGTLDGYIGNIWVA